MSDPIGSFPTPLVELTEANGRYLTLDEGGTVSLVDPVTGTSLFSYSAFGMDTAAYVDSNHIIAGRSATGTINTPLLQINSTTGETVPISDPAIVVYDVAYDAANNRVFSLGIQTTGSGSATTVLESHSVASPGSATTWLTYNGEDHGAGLTIDPATGTVYTSIGFSGVQALSSPGEPAVQFDRTDHVPRKLVVSGNWLYALNTDSTMTIWNKNTGKLLLNLYIFKDDSWAAVLASGQYYSSGGAEQYIKLFNNTTPANSSIDKYRFRF